LKLHIAVGGVGVAGGTVLVGATVLVGGTVLVGVRVRVGDTVGVGVLANVWVLVGEAVANGAVDVAVATGAVLVGPGVETIGHVDASKNDRMQASTSLSSTLPSRS
jgi:hypothetical protein